jgi:hypothetical protein
VHFVKGVLQIEESRIGSIWHRFGRSSRLRSSRFLPREGITVDKRVSRSSSLDLSQSCEIALLETTVPMFELPQCRVRRARVEHITDFVESIHIQLSYE